MLVGEHIRQHRRTLRLVRGVIAALVLLTVTALVAAGVAVGQRDEAQAQRDNALFNQILTRADQLQSSDISLAAQLGAVAYRKSPTPDAYTTLLARGNQARSTLLTGHSAKIRAITYDPRGSWIASGAEDNTIRIWNPSDLTSVAIDLGKDVIVNALTVHPDGRFLVAGLTDGTLRVWDLADPRTPRTVGTPWRTDSADPVVAVAVSPDGHTVAAGAADDRLHLWDITDLERPQLGTIVLPGFRGVAFRSDGQVLAVGDRTNDSVKLWSTADPLHPTPLGTATIGKPDQEVYAVAFSHDGGTLLTGGSDGYTQSWDTADPNRPTIVGTFAASGNTVTSIAVAPDRNATAAIGSVDQRIQLIGLGDPTHPRFLDGDGPLTAPNGYVMALAFAPSGRDLAAGYSDGSVRVWSMPGGYAGSSDQLETVAFSEDGQTLAAAGYDPRIRVWRRDDPNAPTVLAGHTDVVWRLLFGTDGTTLVSASEDGTVRLWNLADREPVPRTLVKDVSPIRDMAISPDGRMLAVVGDAVRLWDLSNLATPPRTLNPGPEPAYAATFGPDGRTLAVGYGDAAIDVWDLTRPTEPAHILNGHTEAVVDLAVSPDGQVLASAGNDQTIRLWNIADLDGGTPAPHVLTGHTDTVNDIAFSPDGHRLASGSNDRTVRLWTLDDPGAPRDLGGPLQLGPTTFGANARVTAVAFAPDGRTLAIGGTDGTARVWDLDPDTLVRRICTTAANNLTPASWEQYFRDQPYQGPACQ